MGIRRASSWQNCELGEICILSYSLFLSIGGLFSGFGCPSSAGPYLDHLVLVILKALVEFPFIIPLLIPIRTYLFWVSFHWGVPPMAQDRTQLNLPAAIGIKILFLLLQHTVEHIAVFSLY